jgi:hypothetical protein
MEILLAMHLDDLEYTVDKQVDAAKDLEHDV